MMKARSMGAGLLENPEDSRCIPVEREEPVTLFLRQPINFRHRLGKLEDGEYGIPRGEIGVHGGKELLPRSVNDWPKRLAATRGRLGLCYRRMDAVELLLCDLETVRVVLDILSVVFLQEAKPHDLTAPLREHVADRHEVAEGLRHLLLLDLQEAIVHPAAGPLGSVDRLADHRLALVVRELQVFPAAMDIDLRPQVLRGHGEALNVPTRSAAPPWAVPGGLVLPCFF